MVTVIHRDVPKARKPHRCDSCGGPISAGEEYHRSRCVDGGDAWTWKSHAACYRASDILWQQGIEGDDGAMINVCDMDADDRALVYRADPETFRKVWPQHKEVTP